MWVLGDVWGEVRMKLGCKTLGVLFFLIMGSGVCVTSKTVVKKLIFNAPGVGNVLTMERAVALAYQHRPDLKALKQLEESFRMQASATRAGYLPTLDMQASVQKWRGQRSPSTNVGMSARQLIYSPTLSHDYKAACADTQRQEFVTEIEKLNIRHAVEVEFLKGWMLQRQEDSIQSLYVSSESSFKEAQHKNKLKLLDKIDWMKSASDYATNLATFYGYEDDISIEQQKLEFLLGYCVPLQRTMNKKAPSLSADADQKVLSLTWESSSALHLHDLDMYLKAALATHPALKEITKRIEIEQEKVRSLQKTTLPTVNLTAGAGYDNPGAPHDHTFCNVGVELSWNIFDGLVNRYKERSENAKLLQERFSYDYKTKEILSSIKSGFYTLSKSMTILRAQEIEFKRAKNEFDRRKEEFSSGLISPVEFKTAKTAWEKARFAWLSMRVDAATKERDLLYACGYPDIRSNGSTSSPRAEVCSGRSS